MKVLSTKEPTMARVRRKIGGAGQFKKYASWNEGDFIVGKLVEVGEDATYGKPTYKIQLEEIEMANATYDYPEGKAMEVGQEITLNSSGSLDHKMNGIAVGTVLEIVYNGTEALPSNHKFSGKSCHQFEVATFEDDDSDVVGSDDL